MKVVVWFFAVILLLPLCSHAQATRVVDWPPVAPVQASVKGNGGKSIASEAKALEIVEIDVEGKTIKPGQPFSAGDDWLRTFAVKVKNISDKNISSIRLHFVLPEAKSPAGVPSGFSLQYGKELNNGIDYGVQPLIEPGKEVVLIRNDRHYTRDKDGIAKRTGKTDFNNVIIAVSTIQFEDGTVWSTYRLPITSVTNESN